MSPGPLALVEVLERDGRVRRAQAVHAWPLRIGRAIDNDLVLDDAHVAPHHAWLRAPVPADGAAGAGAVELVALPSVNGVLVGKRRLHEGEHAPLAGDGVFVVGGTRLRLRLAGEALAPERPLARAPRHAVTLALALLLWAWALAGHAIQLDPGARLSDYLMPLVGVPAVLGGWCLLWALASKLFQHRFDFWPHMAVATRGWLAIEVVGFALPWLAAIGSVTLLSRLAPGAAAACAVAMLIGHARLVAPQQQRALIVLATAAFVVGSAILLALNQQRQDRWFSELYVSALPPPALQWTQGVAPADFVAAARPLRKVLDDAVREAERDARAGREDED